MAIRFQRTLDRILERDLNTPALLVAAGKLGITFARDAYLLMGGVIDRREFRMRTSGNVGSSAGIVAGAAAGAAAGSLLPGVGNIIGAFAGGLFGSIGGQYAGRAIAEYLEPNLEPPPSDQQGTPQEKKAKPNGVDRPGA